jgi:predicted butyrate kinase (DUF1464 family)
MRIIGIDPGTGSFDFFGMDGDTVILDTSISVGEVAQNPRVLLDMVKSVLPLDVIVGPSGYGLPTTPISKMTEHELNLMVPDDKSIPLYDGIRMVLRLMKSEGLPVYFTPGVIHLPTVPAYRKANRMDMGTADKVCCVALAMRDQAESHSINYQETSFIVAEMGYAFSAVIAVQDGMIVDGLGGTSGGPGFITMGSIDAELAIRLGNFPGIVLFSGGAKDMSDNVNLTPEEMVGSPDKYGASINMFIESILKSVASLLLSVSQPREILLSGRLSRIPEIARILSNRLSQFGQVRNVRRRAKVAKEAAEGAYIIGASMSGDKYKGIYDCLKLGGAAGTMYDYILAKGAKVARP